MHSHYQLTQSGYCLVCHEPLNKRISLLHLITPQYLCLKCLKQLEIVHSLYEFHGYKLWILYDYNDFFRGLLFQYKGLYDYELRVVFLHQFRSWLIDHYHDFVIAPVPSDDHDNRIRGFMPNAEIIKAAGGQLFTGLYKRYPYKQSSQDYFNRREIHDVIGIKDVHLLYHKKVLLFDDVVTSGHTLMTCLSLIEAAQPSKIEILVLSSRSRFREAYQKLPY
ncbi:MAG: hypothetical protein J6P61_09160 [Erysipelotrichaceae bacterium]|nr:hypothetical protein [Erysipelotrichaceae bacterium]